MLRIFAPPPRSYSIIWYLSNVNPTLENPIVGVTFWTEAATKEAHPLEIEAYNLHYLIESLKRPECANAERNKTLCHIVSMQRDGFNSVIIGVTWQYLTRCFANNLYTHTRYFLSSEQLLYESVREFLNVITVCNSIEIRSDKLISKLTSFKTTCSDCLASIV